jgi:hypothetical protein
MPLAALRSLSKLLRAIVFRRHFDPGLTFSAGKLILRLNDTATARWATGICRLRDRLVFFRLAARRSSRKTALGLSCHSICAMSLAQFPPASVQTLSTAFIFLVHASTLVALLAVCNVEISEVEPSTNAIQ